MWAEGGGKDSLWEKPELVFTVSKMFVRPSGTKREFQVRKW